MPKKRSTPSTKSKAKTPAEPTPSNAKLCEACGTVNSFKRVKCEKCSMVLPEGKFERSKRLRQQALRQQQQSTLGASLFSDTPGFSGAFTFTDESDSSTPTHDSNIEEVLSSKNKDAEEASRDAERRGEPIEQNQPAADDQGDDDELDDDDD